MQNTPNASDCLVSDIKDGFRVFAHFLLNAEADAICGARRCEQSDKRRNYRRGYHMRSIRTRLGPVFIKVPDLRWLHARPSMSKRFNRLEGLIVEMLVLSLRHGAERGRIVALIRTLWTLGMPEDLCLELSCKAVGVVENWRRQILLREAAKTSGMPGAGRPAESAEPDA